jgi:hypothetical protein
MSVTNVVDLLSAARLPMLLDRHWDFDLQPGCNITLAKALLS